MHRTNYSSVEFILVSPTAGVQEKSALCSWCLEIDANPAVPELAKSTQSEGGCEACLTGELRCLSHSLSSLITKGA